MSRTEWPRIPRRIQDTTTGLNYDVGKLLGKGGFAKVHAFTPLKRQMGDDKQVQEIRGKVVAGKIVAKILLQKQHQREKMQQEIALHKRLKHPNVVQFISNFTTSDFVIITLELCPRKSLMELHKRRGKILEPECRFYMLGVQKGVLYLHQNRIVHRDLKLGNVFLDDTLTCKIGDFGLAAEMDQEGTQRKTMCGTPNYLAPEILKKEGHDYQVDIWSAGCMLYTLICGKPPFETSSLKETYQKIKSVKYTIPHTCSLEAKQIIKRMLERDPNNRPKIDDLLAHSWFNQWTPSELPVSALTTEPRFDEDEENVNPNGGLATIPDEQGTGMVGRNNQALERANEAAHQQVLQRISQERRRNRTNSRRLSSIRVQREHDIDCMQTHLPSLIQMLTSFIEGRPHRKDEIRMDEAERPELQPLFWITKWVDFQDKYGFGYCLSEGHYGVNFRDEERTVLNQNMNNLMYIDKHNTEHHYNRNLKDWPRDGPQARPLTKKIQLTEHFIEYMRTNLLTAGRVQDPTSGDDFARIPYLKKWQRVSVDNGQGSDDSDCIAFMLTNGTFQCNFHQSHVKVILCPLMRAVTFLSFKDPNNEKDHSDKTYGLEYMVEFGMDREPFKYIRYAVSAAKEMLSSYRQDADRRQHRDQRARMGNGHR